MSKMNVNKLMGQMSSLAIITGLAWLTIVSVLLVLLVPCSRAEEQQADLTDLISQADTFGFAELRGHAMDSTDWDARINLRGAQWCYVDWEKGVSITNPSFKCLMLTTADLEQARGKYLDLIDWVARTEPSWKQVYEPAGHEDNFRTLFELLSDNQAGQSVDVRYFKQTEGKDAGKYLVWLTIWSSISIDSAARDEENRKRGMANAVSEDVHEFIVAAADGFRAYKAGDPTNMQDGGQAWKSSRRPFAADLCEVQERLGMATYFCVLSSSTYKYRIEEAYEELIQDVEAALPEGWSSLSGPPFLEIIKGRGFASTNGMTGAIWIDFNKSTKLYELSYQIVSTVKK